MFREQTFDLEEIHQQTLGALTAWQWEQGIKGLEPVRPGPLSQLSMQALRRRIEQSWQPVPARSTQALQEEVALAAVLGQLNRQVDTVSIQENTLLEQLLVQEGRCEIRDLEALNAARALRARLWADVGLEGEAVVVQLDPKLIEPLSQAMARPERQRVRMRLFSLHASLSALLYIAGFLDDTGPQQLFMREVLRAEEGDEEAAHLARQYLWSAYDCVDYQGGVLLVHPGVISPEGLVVQAMSGELPEVTAQQMLGAMQGLLPEEEGLSEAMEGVLKGALRRAYQPDETVLELRLLIKQGVSLEDLECLLEARTCVMPTQAMKQSLRALWAGVPRWGCACTTAAYAVQ